MQRALSLIRPPVVTLSPNHSVRHTGGESTRSKAVARKANHTDLHRLWIVAK